jgi:hypothetical protein
MAYSTTKLELNGMVEEWVSHPVTEGIQKIYTEIGVEPDGPQGMTLARDTAGRVALQASASDGPRILVWGDEWISYASQWQAHTEQQVERLWLNALAWLSHSQTCQRPVGEMDADAGVN